MPVLVPGEPLAQRSPDLRVENRLRVGRWRFRLTVVDGAGNESRPTELVVQVADAPGPLIDDRLRRLGVEDFRRVVNPPVLDLDPIRRP